MTRSQLVFGVALIVVGVLLLLDRTGAVDAWALLKVWWPAIFILAVPPRCSPVHGTCSVPGCSPAWAWPCSAGPSAT